MTIQDYLFEFLDVRKQQKATPITLNKTFNIDDLIVVYYNRFAPNFKFAGERHNFYEFYYVINGKMVVTIDEKRFYLEEGEYIVVPPMLFHSMEPDNSYAIGTAICFGATGYVDNVFDGKLSPFGKQLVTNIINIYAKNCNETEFRPRLISNQNNNKDFAYEQSLLVNIEHLMLLILQEFKNQETISPERTRPQNLLSNEILEYLEKNFTENPTLADISKYCNYSIPHICRVFKHQFGESIVSYMNKLKIDEACKMIEKNDRTLREISEILGFDNIAYFTRIFKQLTGSTPANYRKFAVQYHLLNSKYLPTPPPSEIITLFVIFYHMIAQFFSLISFPYCFLLYFLLICVYNIIAKFLQIYFLVSNWMQMYCICKVARCVSK